MNKTLKILLISFLVLFILAIIVGAIWGYITYKQLTGVMKLNSEDSVNSIQSEFQQVAGGNCSALPSLELKLTEIEKQLKEICSNPVAKAIVIKESGRDVCLELNADSQTRKNLEALKATCSKN